MADGYQKERDLIDLLEEDHGFAAQRSGASGGGTTRDLPDVIAGRPLPDAWLERPSVENLMAAYGGRLPMLCESWAFECKYRAEPTYYFPKEDKQALLDYALAFGAKPRFAFRFNANKAFASGDTNWYLLQPTDAVTTETKVKIDYERLQDVAMTLDEALAREEL